MGEICPAILSSMFLRWRCWLPLSNEERCVITCVCVCLERSCERIRVILFGKVENGPRRNESRTWSRNENYWRRSVIWECWLCRDIVVTVLLNLIRSFSPGIQLPLCRSLYAFSWNCVARLINECCSSLVIFFELHSELLPERFGRFVLNLQRCNECCMVNAFNSLV